MTTNEVLLMCFAIIILYTVLFVLWCKRNKCKNVQMFQQKRELISPSAMPYDVAHTVKRYNEKHQLNPDIYELLITYVVK
jgi:hypothetical protein